MDYSNYAASELTALAERLADAAARQTNDATSALHATYEANIDRLRADQAQVVAENERLTAENAALAWEKREQIDSARTEGRAAVVTRLLEVFDRIARSTTVEQVLLATADGLTDAFSRVSVDAPERVLTPVGAASSPIDPQSRSAVALPITVRAETVAVIYADDERQAGGEGARLADLLRHHAILALERLTADLKALAELRTYARMLIDEVEYVFEADTAARLDLAERADRLRENLRCARQIYQQRTTLDGPAAASVLDAIVMQTLAEKAATPFGLALAAVEIE